MAERQQPVLSEVAFAMHDAECSDRCDPQVMGRFFRIAEALLAHETTEDKGRDL